MCKDEPEASDGLVEAFSHRREEPSAAATFVAREHEERYEEHDRNGDGNEIHHEINVPRGAQTELLLRARRTFVSLHSIDP